jgi:ribosomal protein L3 glutamine methyltransferase
MPSAERDRRARTLRTLLRDTARRLEKARVSFGHGTTNARDEAAWLVLHALKLPFEALEANLGRTLTAAELRKAEALVETRIATRKPAAYLTREAWLGEHRFHVDERVIVPRSYIAELLRDGLDPWIDTPSRISRALDLCTGSGCLAILLALACERARVDACDISADALAVARRNVSDYALGRRVRLKRADLFSGLGGARYDLIVSNPPYVSEAVMRKLPVEYRREPALALAGGRDGLDLVRRILSEADAHLAPKGVLVVEVGHNRTRVERAFPRLPFVWLDTSGGDDCVFLLTKTMLQAALRAPSSARSMSTKALLRARAPAVSPARSPRATRAAPSPRPRAKGSPGRVSAAAGARRRRNARGSAGSR